MKRHLSILARAVAAVLGATILFALMTGVLAWREARDDAFLQMEGRLGDVGVALARMDHARGMTPGESPPGPQASGMGDLENPRPPPPPPMRARRYRHHMMSLSEEEYEAALKRPIEPGQSVQVKILSERGASRTVTFPQRVPGGFSTQTIGGESCRVFVISLREDRTVVVAEPLRLLDEAAARHAFETVVPMLGLLPLLALVLSILLWRSLAPLKRAAREVSRLTPETLEPLTVGRLPAEAEPFVTAVNDLIERVRAARTREIRFVADAAHELRSPLTSLTIEAEHLLRMELPAEARQVLENLEGGLERSVHQVSQLLTFARVQAGETQNVLRQDASAWYMSELVAEVMEPLLDEIGRKGQRFEVLGLPEDEKPVEGASRAAVQTMLRNLLENAVHYAPEGGRVELSVNRSADRIGFAVADDGPGIPEAERDRVFDPFYRIVGSRVPGTGLGLSIVRSCAERTGARVTLDWTHPEREAGRGLLVRVSVPLNSPDTTP